MVTTLTEWTGSLISLALVGTALAVCLTNAI